MSADPKPELNEAEQEAQVQATRAINSKDFDKARALVGEFPSIVKATRWSCLLAAASRQGNEEFVHWLVEQGADPDPQSCGSNHHPLGQALMAGEIGIARWLVARGASLDGLGETSGGVKRLWYPVLNNDDAELTSFVLELLAATSEPVPVLVETLCVSAGRPECSLREPALETLEKLGAEPASVLTEPLLIALHRGNEDAARYFIARGGRLEGCSRYWAIRIWERALKGGGRDFVQLVLDAGFDIPAAEREHGSMIASILYDIDDTKQALPVIEMMIENGLDPNVRSTRRGTALFQALSDGHPEIYRLLLEKGGDLGHENHRKLPFFATRGSFSLDLAELRRIVDAGIPLQSKFDSDGDRDEMGRGPLHAAVEHRASRQAFENLIALGAPIDQADTYAGSTPLHLAIAEKAKDQVKVLLELGADPMAKTRSGKRAIDLARAKTGFKTIVKQMEKRLEEGGIDVGGCEVTLDFVEPWAAALRDGLKDLPEAQHRASQALITLCVETNSSRPSKTFLKKSAALIEEVGADAMRRALIASLPLYKLPRDGGNKREGVEDGRYECGDASWAITEMNLRAMRGLLWASSALANGDMAGVAREVAVAAFKKVYGIGMRNAKIGNAALNALSEMGDVGVGQMAVLSEQIKYNPAKVNVDRVLDRVAKERGIERSQLAEMATPDYGLDDEARYVETFGEFSAELTLLGPGRTDLVWRKGKSGKEQRTVPAAVKRDFAGPLKALKARATEMQKVSTAVRSRLEKQYLDPQGWKPAVWRERYLDHPLAGVIARRLLWRFELGKKTVTALYRDGAFIDAKGKKVAIDKATRVDLWHPLHEEEDVDVVLAWRERLATEDVVQPFKQAYREVYVVTAAEKKTRDHSLRYAGQVMNQAQVHALAGQRGWTQVRSGSWDGEMPEIHRDIPSAGLSVCFDTEFLHDCGTTDHGIYLYQRGGEVSFHRTLKDGEWGAKVNLGKVPPLVFSEIMRDIDLFVGVANAGNDPEWEHRDAFEDWESMTACALRASGETRRAALEAMIPTMAIADRLSLEDRWLVVRGDLSTYKIHLGSANVIMENGHYLCIVRVRAAAKAIRLPFEGDAKFSEILSKALLLAADKKIKDGTILSQIRAS